MKPKIEVRYQRISDAERFLEILTNPKFKNFIAAPKNLAAEKKFIQEGIEKRKKKVSYDYAIIYDGKVVGAAGIMIDQRRPHIGEIGYLVDADYQGKGIATEATKTLEKIAFNKLKCKRIELWMDVRNKPSVKVAEKAGYKREGLFKKGVGYKGRFVDCYIYGKVKWN